MKSHKHIVPRKFCYQLAIIIADLRVVTTEAIAAEAPVTTKVSSQQVPSLSGQCQIILIKYLTFLYYLYFLQFTLQGIVTYFQKEGS